MVVIAKQNVVDILLMEAFYEMHQVRDRLNFFQEKYQQTFENFSVFMKKENENFEYFDDYMEWKAYTKLFDEVLKKIEELKNGNFQIALTALR
ncbi:hypothetical protein [Desulfonema magnum]|uniref:Uncharacterized protein n=1 Tax=Desulfonema magnum TaxID=45655 RepID=A0A975BMC6_9BACT|nr:hypothetical protein [Desulfonema magnum]QTA87887.1 Uncharacterized protein dnm_039270 [Desulfonema magnum]